uniref:Reverse transcriptase domain-containing protein n=1 Tax=Cannabis sativa TaxID=3483 RepID=A0A803NMW7_CANSA
MVEKIDALNRDSSLSSRNPLQARRTKSISPSFLHRHYMGKNCEDRDKKILEKFSSCPIPTPNDARVITTIMTNIRPTYEQMVESPHVNLCKSRSPHKHSEPTHFPWPINAGDTGLAEELMGQPLIDKFEPTLTLFHDPVDVSDHVHHCPRQRKRKFGLSLVPFVQRTPENSRVFNSKTPISPPFPPNSSTAHFSMGIGITSSSSKKKDKRRKKNSRPRLRASIIFTWARRRPLPTPKLNVDLILELLGTGSGPDSPSLRGLGEESQGGVINFAISISDHALILFDYLLNRKRGFFPFHFFKAWTTVASCREVVLSVWNNTSLDPTKGYLKNVDKIKSDLRVWRKDNFEDCDKLITRLEDQLAWIQKQSVNSKLCEEEYFVQEQLREAWKKKESLWRQKSREVWLRLGDRNSKFFHASTIIQRRRNQILSLKDHEGNKCDDRRKMSSIIENYFSVRDTVFDLHPLKAPGPDGLSGCFFRKYWDIVGRNFCDVVIDFFRMGSMNLNLNSTFIYLIPNSKNPERIEQFRPISLCNFLYKVIAKILSNRLRPLMDVLVSPFQYAFILGRWIAESSILTQEIVHKIYHKKGKGGLMAIKLDMHKPYDKMEWCFLHRVLLENIFNEKNCKMILECNLDSNKKASILKNLAISHVRGDERYLGNPFVFKRRKKDEYIKLKESMVKKVEGWKIKSLSYAGRDILRRGSVSLAASGESIDLWHQAWIPWLEFNDFKDLMEDLRSKKVHSSYRLQISPLETLGILSWWTSKER